MMANAPVPRPTKARDKPLNLEELKRNILDDLQGVDLAVFPTPFRDFDPNTAVYWDNERSPNHSGFLNACKLAGCRIVLFAERDFSEEDIEDLTDMLDAAALDREDRQQAEERITELKTFTGLPCALQLSFPYGGHMFVFEVTTEWYDTYLELADELDAFDSGEETPLGGYFSNN